MAAAAKLTPAEVEAEAVAEMQRAQALEDAVEALKAEGLPVTEDTLAALGFTLNAYDRQWLGWPAVEPDDESVVLTEASAQPLRERLLRIEDQIANARCAIQVGIEQRTRARRALADAVASIQTGLPKITPNQLIREHLARSQADLAKRKAQGMPTTARGRKMLSTIDAHAAYGAGGDASDHVRRQMKTGHRRGSYPSTARGARLPSDR